MKMEQILKIVLTVLVIILISLVSFGGIFVKNTKFVESIIPEYQLGTDLKGARHVSYEVSTATKDVYYDKDGNVVSEKTDDTTTKQEPVNPEDALTQENYEKTKQIVEKRLKEMRVSNYEIRQDKKTGKISVQLTEDDNTDLAAQYMIIKGVFTVVNEEGEVLLNNSDIKKAQVGYGTTTAGTTVYLTISFNEEGAKKLKDISNTYVKTTDEEGKETTKQVTLKIDDTSLLSTYFDEELTNGNIQLSIGTATTNAEDIESYLREASSMAVLLNTGEMPLSYSSAENKYIMSAITLDMLLIPAIVVLAILGIGLLFLVIKYKKNGLIVAISYIGYLATVLLAIRYTNVMITLEGMAGVLLGAIINYAFAIYLLNFIKKTEEGSIAKKIKTAGIKSFITLIPVIIIAITFCFTRWLPLVSLGMTLFWSIVTGLIYHVIITRTLLVNAVKNK